MTSPQSKRVGQRLLALLLGLTGAVAAVTPVEAQQAGGRRIEVLFLGHESRHHPSDSAAAFLVPALAKEGINFQYTTDPNDLTRENLARYDALLLYANHDAITPEQEAALMEFVEAGNGFLPIHSASHNFRNSARVVAMMGGQFDRHGVGTFTVPITQPGHPVMQGVQPFETWDETYVHKNHNPQNRTVLMERVEGDSREPWTWVRTQGKGRVFYTAYGHDSRTWKQPAFHALVRNGILWAVGDTVKARWSRLNLPELRYVESSRIPNYERRNPPLKLQEPLAAAQSMKHTQVPPGFELQLFASEPDIVKPIAMTWDERGRLWLAETIDYPNEIHPGRPGNDRIKILEDTNGDGKADKFTVFADSLNIPTGLVFANGGLIVSQQPDLLFFKDTNGDDRADVKQVLVSGFGIRDTHAGPSNLRYGFDNRVWGAVGYSGFESGNVGFGQAIWSMRPNGTEMTHEASFSNNTWGLGFSETFDIFGSTANNTHAVYVGIPHRYNQGVRGLPNRAGSQKIDGHYNMAAITPNVRQVDVFGGFTAAAGFNLYTARTYPQEYWNRIAFVSEPTGRVLHRAVLEKEGAGYVEKDGWNLLASVDEWVGPVDAQVGPDGQVWVADWYNFIIQHNPTPPGFQNGQGNAYENPLRDKTHGRIYRVVYTGGPADRQPRALSADRPQELLQALEDDNLFWRLTAQRLLVERGNRDVVPQLIQLVGSTRTDALGLAPGPLHALWTLHGLGLLDGTNAQAMNAAVGALRHPVGAVRKAATQVLPEDAQLLGRLQASGVLADPDPHTRLAAVVRLTEVPASEELGALLYRMSLEPAVAQDAWLSEAVYVAAATHRPGFLKAYAAALGDAQYRTLAQRLAAEEQAPRQGPPQAQSWPPQDPATGQAAPVAERLLRAYVEDVVGPIQRPQMAGGNRGGGQGGASDEPPLELTMSIIPGQMKFALPEFTAKPGQRVRITLTNPDDMQHNMLVLRPGTIEAVGALADAMVSAPDAAERQYIPPTPDVMWFTPLVDPGQSAVLEFTAPRQAGDYPYVCTFPGHWRIMQGTMKVAG
jgi:uncharacterized protein